MTQWLRFRNSRWLKYFVQLFLSLAVGLFFSSILILTVGEDPLEVYSVLISEAFFRPLGLGIAIQRATPLILTAAAAVLAFQGGAINMGIEGQFMVGAAVAAVAGAVVPKMPGNLSLITVLFFCALGGALAGWIPAFFRMVSGVNEVITGMIANLVIPPLLGIILGLPFLRMARAAASANGIRDWAILPQFSEITNGGFGAGSRANLGIVLAVVVVFFLAIAIKRTKIGFEIRLASANFSMASFVGINARKSFYLALMSSGAVAALGGATEVLGVWRGYRMGTLSSIGYNGLLVALAGGNNFVGSLLAASVYGGLQSGAMNASWATPIPRPLIDVLVEIIIVFAAVPSMRLFFSGTQNDADMLGSQFTHKNS